VHLGIIPVNNQLDTLFQYIYFFTSLHVSSTQCSSSGETNCINTSSGMYHCVKVTAWYAGQEREFSPDRHTRQSPPWSRTHQGSRKLRFPDFMTTAQYGGKVCQPYALAAFIPRKCNWYSFLLEAESTSGP
jgi:hypothetical protein